MFLTLTPNPCIERTLRLPAFEAGRSFRVPSESVREDAGGKGVNAARVAQTLGATAVATGWIGRDRAAWLRAELERAGVAPDFVETSAPTRIATNILAGDAEVTSTEIVEAGHALSLDDGTRLLQRFESLISEARLCAVCGSFPPSAPAEEKAFAALGSLLVRVAARHRVPVIVDGKGRAFEVAVKSRPAPWLVKPNLDEARELLHRAITTPADERRAVLEILRLGPQIVLLSCGARGCYVGFEKQVWLLSSPVVKTVSAVGSGDALVGAFAARYLDLEVTHGSERERILDAARWGVAAGAANAARPDAGWVTRGEVAALVGQVKVGAQVMALAN